MWIFGGFGRTLSVPPTEREDYSCDLQHKGGNAEILGQPRFRTSTRGRLIYSADMERCMGHHIVVSWSCTVDMRGLSF